MTQEEAFGIKMRKREANARAMDDYDRALSKYTRPRWLYGYHTGKATQILNDKNSLVVQVLDTTYEDILLWKDGVLRPMWKARIVRDPLNLMRSVRNPYIEGPCYEIGKAGSVGPFYSMTDDFIKMGMIH